MDVGASGSFVSDFVNAVQDSSVVNWVTEHPVEAAVIGAGVTMFAAPGLISSPALGVLGFGSEGITASYLAAAWQASIGDVVAGSVFATLQSAGAGGYGLGVVNGVLQAAGATSVVAEAFKLINAEKGGQEGEYSACAAAAWQAIIENMAATEWTSIIDNIAATELQTSIGDVVAGSTFAALQSAGAGGALKLIIDEEQSQEGEQVQKIKNLAAAAVAAPGILSNSALGLAGLGVKASMMAAGWQSSIGNVVAPSLFAKAAGFGAAAVNPVVQAANAASLSLGEKYKSADMPKGRKEGKEKVENKSKINTKA